AVTLACTVVASVTGASLAFTGRVWRPAAARPWFSSVFASFRALTDVGVTEALAPLGVPDTLRLIVPPLATTVVEMVLEPLVPCTRLTLLGLRDREVRTRRRHGELHGGRVGH